MGGLDMGHIADQLGATRKILEPDGSIHVVGPGLDRKIEFLTEAEVAERPDLRSAGFAEGRDFYCCLNMAGNHTGGKVWREATVYTSQPGEKYSLRLSFYKPRQ